MGFLKNLPVWLAVGSEPPVALKNTGYKEKDAPAPNHFNYMFNRTYQALDELQKYAVHKDDYKTVTEPITGLAPRLNTAASSALTLKGGIQTITSDRDKPFNLTSIRGQLLLNLLGRTGNFETLIGWTTTGATIALNTANALYSSNCVQITLGSTSGRVSRTINTVSGKTYVVAVEARIGTATNARVDVTGQGNGNTVTNVSAYQISYMRFTANAATHTVGITVTGTSGQTVFADGFRVYEVSSTEYTAFTTLTADTFAAKYPYTEGLAGVKNPYSIRWTDANKTEIAALLAFDTELLASPTADADTDREVLSVGADGQYIKSSMWRKIILGGDLQWIFKSSSTGFKRVQINSLANGIETTPQGYLIKYDGSVMTNDLGAIANWTTGDIWQLGDAAYNNLYVSIATADSGWGDNYTPSNDEIKAYFYGWRMYNADAAADGTVPYNGTGVKAWGYRVGNGSNNLTGGTTTLPTTLAANFTPYELMYRRATSITVPVASEGGLALAEGVNAIEVGSGLIIRESIRPILFSDSKYYINSNSVAGSNTSRKPRKVLSIYKNGRDDTKVFVIYTDAQSNGVTAQVASTSFDTTATYSISYFDAALYPTAPFIGTSQNNERAILNDLVHDVESVTRRVSVNELRKAEKDAAAVSITPTFLSNWSALNTENGYSKIAGLNMVYFRFSLTGGATAFATPLFVFASGYRPKKIVIVNCVFRDNGGNTVGAGAIQIDTTGRVVLSDGNFLNGALHFSGVFTLD